MTNPNDLENFQFKKNDTVSLRQFVYQEIREAIIKGHLEPGARLREVEISKQMNVSRGPIREAIRILEQEGLVISHPYRETVVADLPKRKSFICSCLPGAILNCLRHRRLSAC